MPQLAPCAAQNCVVFWPTHTQVLFWHDSPVPMQVPQLTDCMLPHESST